MDHLYINWVDPVIVLLLVLFVWALRKASVLTHSLIIIGFLSGLFFGGWLIPHLLPIHNITLKTIINENLVLIFAIYVGIRGYDLGSYIKYKFNKAWLAKLQIGVGIVFNSLFGLIVIWLVASMIGTLPFAGLSNSANDSLIVQLLVQHLPPVPAVFSEFDRTINPNNPPEVFLRSNHRTELYVPISSPALKAAANADESSIVRVTSFGCGGIISGSGFVAAPDLIITNAHVIAGARRPIVKYGTQSYAGTVVLFNPDIDLAAIRLTNLNAPSLSLDKRQAAAGTPIAVLGYPNSNYTVLSGGIKGEQLVYTSNLYGVGNFGRAVYEVQAAVEPGSSGSPMILQNGQVAGVIFSKSDTLKDTGFALNSQNLISLIHQAQYSTRQVSTGVCISD